VHAEGGGVEHPAAADHERGYLFPLRHPVDGARRPPEKVRKFFDGQEAW
jgi:hypothetical protein